LYQPKSNLSKQRQITILLHTSNKSQFPPFPSRHSNRTPFHFSNSGK
jgi:hypothetical protein